MSLEHLSATCRAARMHIEHPITAASRRRQALRRLQSLHWLLTRRLAQMEAQPDMPAVSLPQLTLSVRLCDYADCRRLCTSVQGRRLLLQGLPGVRSITPCRPLGQETGKHDQATRTR